MTRQPDPIAIVGIGCRFPGGVTDVESFWRLVIEGQDAIGEIPADRVDIRRYFDPRPSTPGRMTVSKGGFLDHIDEFDAEFFGISPREAELLDPQQRLLLETAWEALEDAGADINKLDGSRTGVFIGQWTSDFEARVFADPDTLDFYTAQGSGRYASSGRISYVFGLRGPSLTLDTACSSSLVAIHLAARSLRDGESELALAGGVNVILQPHISIAYSQASMMAADGRCKFGDAAGDGYVRSEGAALVVLKALDRAVADGDRIYAVIRGSAVNNDGRSSGSMGTPSQCGQEELLWSAYRDAGLDPTRVGYFEAHGTGTRVGDPVELGALATVVGRHRDPRTYVGSVKTNLGHTEGAAGIAGLIKVALALYNKTIPPSLHFNEPNPAIPWSDIGLAIPSEPVSWTSVDGSLVGGVSAFGIAGTNAHVVLEEAPTNSLAAAVVPKRPATMLPLSAKSDDALRALAAQYAALIGTQAGLDLHDICWNAASRRTPLDHRAVIVADDRVNMVTALRNFAEGAVATAQGIVRTSVKPKIAFVCPGQGGQWAGMARQLLEQEPVFRDTLQRCDEAARGFVDYSIVAQLGAEPGTETYLLDRIDVIQPVLVALAIGYAALLRSFGVEADAVVGHSMGEVAAAHIAGVLDLDQAMHVICRRSALMQTASGNGAMAMVDLSITDARTRIIGREDRLSVAVSNSPRSSVISGDPEALRQVVMELERDEIFCRYVKVDVASHSPQMTPLARELSSELTDIIPSDARIPVWSTVLGRRANGRELDAAYWGNNLRQTVRFTEATSQILEEGVTIFVEFGPHPVLLYAVQQTAQSMHREVATTACGSREATDQAAILMALGQMWAAGFPIDWERVAPQRGRIVPMPHYPWQRRRHWATTADRPADREAGEDYSRSIYRLRWELSNIPKAMEDRPAAKSTGWLIVAADQESASTLAAAFNLERNGASVAPFQRLAPALEEFARQSVASRGIVVLADCGVDSGYLPIAVLQAVLRTAWTSIPRIWFVTRGAQAVTPNSTEQVSVDQAALWGASRVVAEEHPELWGGIADLDPDASLEAGASILAQHIVARDGEDQVAFRSHQRYVLRLVPYRDNHLQSLPFSWRPDAAYLITGGLGGIGLHVARALAAAGVRHLVILTRTPLPARENWTQFPLETAVGQRVAAVQELEAAGVSLEIAALDVSDEVQLRTFLAHYCKAARPRIRGVIHAAVSVNNDLSSAMDRAAFDTVVGPKLRAAQLLDRHLPDLDLFVLFSSIGGFLAYPGIANYAAANCGLDALAHNRRVKGLPALSIAWGPWEKTGLASGKAGEHLLQEFARQGIQAISPQRGTALFAWLCNRSDAAVAVLDVDWAAFRHAKGGRDLALLRQLSTVSQAATNERPELDRNLDLVAIGPAERRKSLDGIVRNAVAAVLKIAPSRLDERKVLGDMGLGSLLAIELRNRLEADLRRPLPATLAWNYPTMEAIVGYLSGDEHATSTPPGPPQAAALPAEYSGQINRVAELTDAQAVAALRG